MNARHQQTFWLVLTLDDYHRELSDPKGPLRNSLSGFAPTKKVVCPECRGEEKKCEFCQGRRKVWLDPMRKGKGQSTRVHDMVVEAPEPVKRTPLAVARTQQIPAAKRGKKHSPYDLSDGMDRLKMARLDRDKSGSYKQLEAALDWLADADPGLHHALRMALIDQVYGPTVIQLVKVWLRLEKPDKLVGRILSAEQKALSFRVARAVRLIADRLPDQIQVPVDLMVRLEADRGTPIGQMSRDLGISRERVKRKLRRAA